ncbi:MAG: MgtC/SapB family protein [Victivallales bacterium]|nr:MgtC/SapB family protein [Victivallales bacterium]
MLENHDLIGALMGEWALQSMHLGAILLRVCMALFLSAMIGCERATKRHTAGLRTFILAGVASVFAALCDEFALTVLKAPFTFLSAAALICVSMISGNTLLFSSRNQLKGLTTSVCLLSNSIISLCIGFGMYTSAIIGFFAMIMCVALFPNLETQFKRHSKYMELHLELTNKNALQDFIKTIREFGLHLDEIEFNPAYANTGLGVYTLKVTIKHHKLMKAKHREIVEALSTLDNVEFIEEI